MKKNIKAWKSSLGRINNLREKVVLVSLGVFISIAFTTIASEGVNPFEPIYETTSGPNPTDYVGIHPLQKYQAKSYILAALITSKKGNIAMVKVKNGQEYFVRMNDVLGNSGGRITSFTKNGIEITQKDEVVVLVVRNKGSK
ncbi:hypothetical protein MNB_SUP05-4-686 [hydrothermal vent metagenome]|uniref:Uncharacterized protein n=1 Tax=hydrothermal vent metagenome TaxID=652676 RepID=A0A1W1DAP9_9ZZZZ